MRAWVNPLPEREETRDAAGTDRARRASGVPAAGARVAPTLMIPVLNWMDSGDVLVPGALSPVGRGSPAGFTLPGPAQGTSSGTSSLRGLVADSSFTRLGLWLEREHPL